MASNQQKIVFVIVTSFLFGIGASGQQPSGKTVVKKKASAPAPKKSPLTLDEVVRLMQLTGDDGLVADSISARGLAGTLNRETISQLGRRNVGAKALAAATALLPFASVEIRSASNAAAILDGRRVGNTDPTGRLVLRDLDPGSHELTIQKQDFREYRVRLQLEPRKLTAVDAPLVELFGFIQPFVTPAGSQLQIDSETPQSAGSDPIRLTTGTHSLQVSLRGFKTVTESVTIPPGGKVPFRAELLIDPVYWQSIRDQVVSQSTSADCRNITALRSRLDSLYPGDRGLLHRYAECAFSQDNPEFARLAAQVVKNGDSLSFTFRHHHAAAQKVHPAKLIISESSVGFDPLGNPCTVTDTTFSRTGSKIARAVGMMRMQFVSPANPKKTVAINVYVDDVGQTLVLRWLMGLDP